MGKTTADKLQGILIKEYDSNRHYQEGEYVIINKKVRIVTCVKQGQIKSSIEAAAPCPHCGGVPWKQ